MVVVGVLGIFMLWCVSNVDVPCSWCVSYLGIAIGVDVLLSYPSVKAAIFRDKDIKDGPYVRHQ